jgi:hypothetical protein
MKVTSGAVMATKESKVEVEVAVLHTKVDHIEESIHGIRDQIHGLDARIGRLERVTYMLLGGLLLLQSLPIIQEMLTSL